MCFQFADELAFEAAIGASPAIESVLSVIALDCLGWPSWCNCCGGTVVLLERKTCHIVPPRGHWHCLAGNNVELTAVFCSQFGGLLL